jgi:hypothetical protein
MEVARHDGAIPASDHDSSDEDLQKLRRVSCTIVLSESHLEGGVNRRKLKFTSFKHNYKPGLALEIKLSPKERVKTNQPRNKANDMVICFTEVWFLQT